MKIVVLDGYTLNPGDNPWDRVAELGQVELYDRTGPDELASRAAGAEVLVVNKSPVRRESLAEIWNSGAYRRFRAGQRGPFWPTCSLTATALTPETCWLALSGPSYLTLQPGVV